MKKISLTLLGIAMIYTMAFGQNQIKTKRVGYGIGYSQTSLLDNSVSQYKYYCDNIPFHFRYSIEKRKTIFEYDFNGIVGFNYKPSDAETVLPPARKSLEDSGIGNMELSSSILFQQQASVRYLVRVHQFLSGKLDLFMGGEIREHFLISFADNPIFTFAELGFNYSILLNHQFNSNHSIKAHLAWTLIGTRVNLPNSNIPDIVENGPDGSFLEASFTYQQPWNHKRRNLSIEYVRQLSEEWSVGCELGHYCYRLTENSKVNYSDNSLVFKLTRTL